MTAPTLPAAPVKLDYRSNSANIAFYRIVGSDTEYLEVIRLDDFNYVRFNRARKPTKFGFRFKTHNGRKWTEQRFDYTPKTKPAPGNLPLRTVNRIVNAWLKENA